MLLVTGYFGLAVLFFLVLFETEQRGKLLKSAGLYWRRWLRVQSHLYAGGSLWRVIQAKK